MRLDSLKHIAHSVLAMTEGERVIVFGSASLLASFPELGEQQGSPFIATYDADLLPFPFDEEIGLMLDEAFGEDRTFHQHFGYHADIVRPTVTETFPHDWESRLIAIDSEQKILCLDPHDLAAVKCLIGRDKDHQQLQYLLIQNLLTPELIQERLDQIPLQPKLIVKSHQFLRRLTETLN